MNAALQSLLHIPSFINWLEDDSKHRESCNPFGACIICTLADLGLKRLRISINYAHNPFMLFNMLHKMNSEIFPLNQMGDAHEVILFLFESIVKSFLKRFDEYEDSWLLTQ